MIEYIDRIYGKIIIEEDIILELINSKEFKKLKYIKQYGIPAEMSNLPNFTRFEHSLGVYCILSKFNCSLKEKIVGLLHDISHTAYSHTIDFVLGDSKEQDFQDTRHYEFIKNSSIATILDNYNYDIEEIAELLKYPNVKTKDGSLNADNLDYGLREISYNENFGLKYAKECFNKLTLNSSGYVFKSFKYAKNFAKGFSESRNYYESFERIVKFYLFAKFLKKAYDRDIINDFDFDLDDYRLMEKIFNSKDDILISIYNILKSDEKYFNLDDSNEDEIIFTKYRNINPLYFETSQTDKVSEGLGQEISKKFLSYDEQGSPQIVSKKNSLNDKILNLKDNDEDYKNEIDKKIKLYKNGIKYKITNYYLKKMLE